MRKRRLSIDELQAVGGPDGRRRRRAEQRRLDILDVATAVFLEQGYEAGAMSEVARRVGGSKATLYGYFESKPALFSTVVREGAARHGRQVFEGFEAGADLADDLRRLGRMLLTATTREDHLALRRAVIAESGRSDLGRLYCERWRGAALTPLTSRLCRAMEQGELRPADPEAAAMHFKALCQAQVYELRLQGVLKGLTSQEIACTVDDAVAVFLRAYAAAPPSLRQAVEPRPRR